MGFLHYRCALPGFDADLPASPQHHEDIESLLSELDVEHLAHLPSQRDFDTAEVCSVSRVGTLHHGSCAAGHTCTFFKMNPEEGLTSFDSMMPALVTLLRTLTFDDWTRPMYDLMVDYPPLVPVLFFSFVVIFCGFYLVCGLPT